jgi:hypothetical protein
MHGYANRPALGQRAMQFVKPVCVLGFASPDCRIRPLKHGLRPHSLGGLTGGNWGRDNGQEPM